MKKYFRVLVAVLVFIMIAGCGSSTPSSAKYLPKSSSEYDMICTKTTSGDTIVEEVVGVRKFTNYVSFSFAYIFSKADGSPIEQNEQNIQTVETNRKSLGASATSRFEDGKVIINHGTSDYSITDLKTAKQQLTSNGYTCK